MRFAGLLAAFMLFQWSGHLSGAEAPVVQAGGAEAVVKVMGMEINPSDLTIQVKDGYTFVLVDAYPLKDAVSKKGKGFSWRSFCLELAKTVVFGRDSEAAETRINVVEFPERDDYGAPRWDSLVKVAKYRITRGKKGFTVVDEMKAREKKP